MLCECWSQVENSPIEFFRNFVLIQIENSPKMRQKSKFLEEFHQKSPNSPKIFPIFQKIKGFSGIFE